VFLEDVPGTAAIGDIKVVKAGFARNYLLPRRLAAPATEAIVKSAEQRAKREARLQEARDNEARTQAEKLASTAFTVIAKAGPTGKLFGSVGTNDVAAKVGEALGTDFDRQNVLLAENIKDLGDYDVLVRLTRNVNASVKVSVVGEDGTTAADIQARKGAEEAAAAEALGTDDGDAEVEDVEE
jgi:large subunit ribosomal protein L9